jgi:hypothetical protein
VRPFDHLNVVNEKSFAWGVFFFVYGGLFHLALYWFYVDRGHPGPVHPAFLGSALARGGLASMGGLLFAALMLRLLARQAQRGLLGVGATILRSGLSGIVATVLTLEICYALISTGLAFWSSDRPYAPSFPERLFLFFVEVQTYGMGPVMLSAPFAFVYGGIAGGVLVLSRRSLPSPLRSDQKPLNPSEASLVSGVVGFVFSWLPIGALLGLGAVLFGVRALRHWGVTGWKGKLAAVTGVALGVADIVILLAVLAYKFRIP